MTQDERIVDEIIAIYGQGGDSRYSEEAVSQLEHALQSAQLAEDEGANDALIGASLLHDIGHLLHDLGRHPAARGVDDRHESLGGIWLDQRFSSDVSGPVKLHVAAKQYLCAVDPQYWSGLSEASRTSLELQGGIFPQERAQRFIESRHGRDAVSLRRWDDRAKEVGRRTPDLEHYRPLLRGLVSC